MKISPTAVYQAAKVLIKPHTAMIKFRYGGLLHPSSNASQQGTQVGVGSPSKPNARIAFPTIQDWQLPARYQRRFLEPIEIDYINRGGPE